MLASLALARVVTRDLVVSQNKNFGRNPSWSDVKPVVTRGFTVFVAFGIFCEKISLDEFRFVVILKRDG
jgi:hypothetical protein